MKRKSVGKVLVNGTAYLFSVVLLLSMVAAPVIASVSANSVGTYHIKDNSILNKDIRPNKISSSRIKNYTIRKEDIHSGSINKYKLMTGAVNSVKILDGSIFNRDIANGAINSTKIENGAVKDEDLSTKTGYLSIPPAALNTIIDGIDYARNYELRIISGGPATFQAPVQLPDGAIVTKLRYRAKDNNTNGSKYTSAHLRRLPHSNQTLEDMAVASTQGLVISTSWRTVSDSIISNPIIDNNTYAYYVSVYLADPANLWGGNIVIEYTYKR